MMGDSLCDGASLAEQGVQNLDIVKLELVGGSSSSVGSARPPAAHVPLRAPGRTAAPPGQAELRPREPIRAPPFRRAAPSGSAELHSSSGVPNLVEDLVCPICLELPAGEVHQCHEGHCYCVDCWRRLHPRHCPECREPIPRKNRNRDREARIAALPAACDHCDQITTRGAMAEHLRTCQQRLATCTAAHEKTRPLAQQSLAGLVRALDGDEEEYGRRRRQRVGPAPHDAPPSDATMAEMGMAEATAALSKHFAVARVAELACSRLRTLTKGVGKFSEPMERQGIEAVVEAMEAHPQVANVQKMGCAALSGLTKSLSTVGRQAAAEAGAIGAVLDAMQEHLQDSSAQILGFDVLETLCYGYDAALLRAAEAGALHVAVAAMQAHPQNAKVQVAGSKALIYYSKGDANKRRATQVGGRAVAWAAIQAFPGDRLIQGNAQHLLGVLPIYPGMEDGAGFVLEGEVYGLK